MKCGESPQAVVERMERGPERSPPHFAFMPRSSSHSGSVVPGGSEEPAPYRQQTVGVCGKWGSMAGLGEVSAQYRGAERRGGGDAVLYLPMVRSLCALWGTGLWFVVGWSWFALRC